MKFKYAGLKQNTSTVASSVDNGAILKVYAKSGSTNTRIFGPTTISNDRWSSDTYYTFIADSDSITFEWVNTRKTVSGNDFAIDDLEILAQVYTISGTINHDPTKESVDGTFIANIKVYLYNEFGTKIDSTLTNSSGNYSFSEKFPGKYEIGVALPNNHYYLSGSTGTPLAGYAAFTVSSADVSNINIGINDKPKANNNSFVTKAGDTTTNILANDSLNGTLLDPADVTTGAVSAIPSGLTLNTDGTVTIGTDVPSGTYTFDYSICENGASPANCDTATVTINVENAIIATNDDYTLFPGEGSPVSIFDNDSINGSTLDTTKVTVTIQTPVPPGIHIEDDGTVNIDNGTTPGTYTIDYELCEIDAQTPNCVTGTITVTVSDPMSVDVLNFIANKIDNQALLKWTLSKDETVETYEVQRSINNQDWFTIANVKGGKSETEISYTETDENPANGMNYYRIKIINEDNTVDYTIVRSLQFENTSPIRVYPNPATNYIVIENLMNSDMVQMYDVSGRLVTQVKSMTNTLEIDLSRIISGQYVIYVTNNNQVKYVQKISVTK